MGAPLALQAGSAALGMASSIQQQKNAADKAQADWAWRNVNRRMAGDADILRSSQQAGTNLETRVKGLTSATIEAGKNMRSLENMRQQQTGATTRRFRESLSTLSASQSSRGTQFGGTADALKRQAFKDAAQAHEGLMKNFDAQEYSIRQKFEGTKSALENMTVTTPTFRAPEAKPGDPGVNWLGVASAGMQGFSSGMTMSDQLGKTTFGKGLGF